MAVDTAAVEVQKVAAVHMAVGIAVAVYMLAVVAAEPAAGANMAARTVAAVQQMHRRIDKIPRYSIFPCHKIYTAF